MTKAGRARKDMSGASTSEPFSTVEELRNYIPYLLNLVTNRWNLDQNRDLNEHGINSTVLRTLSVLNMHPTLTVNEIAAYAVIEQSNASRTIDLMVADGLVQRQISEKDLRRREIVLTDKGRSLLHTLWPLMVCNHQRLIAGIPEKDLKTCVNTLKTMIRNLGEAAS